MIYHAISRKRLPLKAVLMSFLFVACFGAMAVHAEDDAAVQEGPGEVSLKTERTPDEATPASGTRPVENDPHIMHGTIDLPTGGGEPATPVDVTPLPEGSHLLNDKVSIPATASATNPKTDTAKKRERVTPNSNYKGKSIASAKATSAPAVKEKNYSLHAQAQTTKARSVKSEVAYADSPELQAYNEKRKKIKEHFKAQLENRPERKAKKDNN